MPESLIAHAQQRAAVTEAGATLRLYEVGGFAVVDGFDDSEMAPACHGQVLAPWPNRLGGGHWVAPDGSEQQLPIDEVARGNAIHGLVNWMAWQVVDHAADAVTLECRPPARPGYPFELALRAVYALSDAGLSCTVTARNLGAHAAPYGIGHHPYIACPNARAGDAVLHIPAGAVLDVDAAMLPTGTETDVAGTDLDFRTPRRAGTATIDHTYTRLQPDGDGVFRCSVGDGATWRTTVWMRQPMRWLQVFSSDTLHGPRHRRAIAVEPMTCPPDALRSGVDVIVLQPGEQVETAWGVEHSR